MSTLLDKALAELKQLPEDIQDAIASDILDMIRSEQRWDKLFADPRSESALGRLAAEAEAEIARGDVFDCDPATRKKL